MPLAVITGPTASGKSALAYALVECLGIDRFEILCCDSMVVYRGLAIGTEKPDAGLLRRIPHHGLDLVDMDSPFDVGDYIAYARRAIEEIKARNKIPLVVGGTGLYLRALAQGLLKLPPMTGEKVQRFRQTQLAVAKTAEGLAHLFRRLEEVDPESAHRIHVHDAYRIIRALEVYEMTGRALSEFQKEHRFAEKIFALRKVALDWPREVLYQRIDRRIDRMLNDGLRQEIDRLLAAGYGPELRSLKGLAYKFFFQALQGSMTWEQAITRTKQASRRFAKRQLTWFRADRDLHWLSVQKSPLEGLERAIHLLGKSIIT